VEVPRAAGIGEEAVRARTGKTWVEWFRLLDAAGAEQMTHREITARLGRARGVSAWWQQMIAVAYEQERGLRQRHERPDGFSVNVSRTVAAPVADLYRAWQERRLRARWLPDAGFVVRHAAEGRSLRITWVDGRTRLGVDFYARGERKSQVAVEHQRLADADEVSRMKSYWSKALDALRDLVED
jgi:uncharacterized protein YndB with AHSA1/START domain